MSAIPLPDQLKRVHMVGIGGAGMSGVARILLDRGGLVSGSDAKESRGVAALRARGAVINIGHDESSLDLLPGGPTAVVTTYAAIPKTNPELVEARRRGIPVILRPVVLARLMDGYTTLMVTGTAGKTTTTSMLIVALQHSGFDPSFAVGGDLGEAGTNAHHGSGTCFVAEADESDGSLLEYTPDVAVVTNVEADHLDFFGTPMPTARSSTSSSNDWRPAVCWSRATDDDGAAALADRSEEQGIRVLRYGSSDDGEPVEGLAATLLSWEQQGTNAVAHITLAGEPHPRVMRLAVPGRHMALNALAALLAAIEAGAPVDDVLDGLAGFDGVRRRFELVGTVNGVRVFDDYAHHPTKVRAALSALRTLARQGETTHAGAGRAVVVFQPHLYSRTQTFAREFGEALSDADQVFVLDVYGAREQPIAGVSGAIIVDHVDSRGDLPAGFLRCRRAGGQRGAQGRCRRHDGGGRRHDARPRDRRGDRGAGQPVDAAA